MQKHLYINESIAYQHKNPYHHLIASYHDFVLRDVEAENFKGNWKSQIFKNSNPIHLEIGCGYGEFIKQFYQNNRDLNCIGMDNRFKRSFNIAKKIAGSTSEYDNFRFLRAHGERLSWIFDKDEVSSIYLFFPDPWPKNRHHKKRLFQSYFLDSAFNILKPQGTIFIKTDHDDYFKWMEDEVRQNSQFEVTYLTYDLWNSSGEQNEDGRNASSESSFLLSFKTKFENIFIGQNIKIKAMVLRSLKQDLFSAN